MNPKIYSNINNYLIIYTPKVIPWGQMDKQTNGRTNKQTDGPTNIYSIFRDKLSLPHGSLDSVEDDLEEEERRVAEYIDKPKRESYLPDIVHGSQPLT